MADYQYYVMVKIKKRIAEDERNTTSKSPTFIPLTNTNNADIFNLLYLQLN